MSTEFINRFYKFIESVPGILEKYHFPGMAIGVIKDGKVFYHEGFGKRDVYKDLPVNQDTLFAIGSITKSFTALLLGILVDKGLAGWDDPVQKYLQNFKLDNPQTSEMITIRDLLCHRSGYPSHDCFHFLADYSRYDIVKKLRYLESFGSIRSQFEYNNVMFVVAGVIVEKISGKSWEECITNWIFEPLKMERANTSIKESEKTNNFAVPYTFENDLLKVLSFRNLDGVGPAGSINASLEDCLKWIKFWIDPFCHTDKKIVSELTFRELLSPQIVVPEHDRETIDMKRYDELGILSYALGWGVHTYRGTRMIQHGGSIDGFKSYIEFSPGHRFGVVVLTNSDHMNLRYSIAFTINDIFLDLQPIDWVSRILDRDSYINKFNEQQICQEIGSKNDMEKYSGRYFHPAYGSLTLQKQDGFVFGKFNAIPVRLYKNRQGEFLLKFLSGKSYLDQITIEFLSNECNIITAVEIPFEKTVNPIHFVKLTEK